MWNVANVVCDIRGFFQTLYWLVLNWQNFHNFETKNGDAKMMKGVALWKNLSLLKKGYLFHSKVP